LIIHPPARQRILFSKGLRELIKIEVSSARGATHHLSYFPFVVCCPSFSVVFPHLIRGDPPFYSSFSRLFAPLTSRRCGWQITSKRRSSFLLSSRWRAFEIDRSFGVSTFLLKNKALSLCSVYPCACLPGFLSPCPPLSYYEGLYSPPRMRLGKELPLACTTDALEGRPSYFHAPGKGILSRASAFSRGPPPKAPRSIFFFSLPPDLEPRFLDPPGFVHVTAPPVSTYIHGGWPRGSYTNILRASSSRFHRTFFLVSL